MREIRPSGSVSGRWKRTTAAIETPTRNPDLEYAEACPAAPPLDSTLFPARPLFRPPCSWPTTTSYGGLGTQRRAGRDCRPRLLPGVTGGLMSFEQLFDAVMGGGYALAA